VLEVYRVSWGEEHPETASAMILLTGVELAMLSNKVTGGQAGGQGGK
jgi:hypothetical protein